MLHVWPTPHTTSLDMYLAYHESNMFEASGLQKETVTYVPDVGNG